MSSPEPVTQLAPDAPRPKFNIRYDDLTQQAYVKLPTMQLAMGRLCMEALWAKHPLFESRKQGVVPILSRMVLESEPVAVSYGAPLEASGFIEFAHEQRDQQVSALFMNGTADVWAMPSRRNPAVDPKTRQPVRIGRVFGEHVMTKPFGPPEQRKVLQWDVPGQPAVPASIYSRVRIDDNAALPEGALALDDAFTPDDAPWTFGIAHTDLNQHVNSLVYARLFEEAALRRAAKHGLNKSLFGKKIALSYRKPCFAGESMVCMVQSFTLGGAFGAVGYLGPSGAPLQKAHCSFQLHFLSL